MLQEMGIGRYRERGCYVVENDIMRCKQYDDVLQGTVQYVAGKVELSCEEWWSALQDSGALF